ncbi:hypothetical protein L484_012906 [Morus notabilis]|uniref:Uncharacterized protein n=1 Tax=Morus notabilis TaxID=981085 RepID=W9QZ04_9ROSA|nr:hypothetical protein L484_012906 [Morus notabilis]
MRWSERLRDLEEESMRGWSWLSSVSASASLSSAVERLIQEQRSRNAKNADANVGGQLVHHFVDLFTCARALILYGREREREGGSSEERSRGSAKT